MDSVDDEQRYQAAASRDARFDGVFYVAVTSTGIYCRPSCPAITPKRRNVRFFKSSAAAQDSGFRACKRCRPDASPGSPEWNVRADVTARAMRLIADGVLDRDGVAGLADKLGYEQRQVRRLLVAELGAGPLALARAQRAQTARVLIETTSLPMGDIAFAAGFSSIRQFNATIGEVFDTSPTTLRDRAARHRPATSSPPGVIRLRLPFRPPLDAARLLDFLGARAIPGVEEVAGGAYRRTILLPNGSGLLSLRPLSAHVECDLELSDLRDVGVAVQRCRRLLDLDADPAAISEFLADDPVIGPLVRECPGRRSPGHADGGELAMRALLGQQVSVAAARTLGGRLVMAYGKPLPAPRGTLTHLFPDAETIAAADPSTLPMPRSRGSALVGLATALASGDVSLHPGADRDQSTARLLALPGVGPWTASYIRMRALSDPDVFLPDDAGVLRALRRLGTGPDAARAWQPWRSYAVHHLWATSGNPIPKGLLRMIIPFLPAEPGLPVCYDIVDSPVGRLLLTGDDRALTGLYMLDAGSHSASVRPGWVRREGAFPVAAAQLGEYFAGERTSFDLPLAPHGTAFQLAVWEELARIPYGNTASYGDVALALGKSLVASRAVGLANGRNPISIIVPCHRVIGSDGSMTGYGWGVERKEWLLRHEGALTGTDVTVGAQPGLW